MLTGRVPFDGGSPKRIIKQQVAGDVGFLRPAYELTVSNPAKRLILLMLETDVLKRARLSVIKRSQWMNAK